MSAIPDLTVDDPSPAVLQAAVSVGSPELWWRGVVEGVGLSDGGLHCLWLDSDPEERELQTEEPTTRQEKISWMRSYAWVKVYMESKLPAEIVALEPVSRRIGKDFTGKTDLFLTGRGIVGLIKDLQSRAVVRAPVQDQAQSDAQAPAQAPARSPAPAQGPQTGRATTISKAMRKVHFSEPDDEPIRGEARARPQPATRSKVRRGEGVSDATTGRVTPALPFGYSAAGDSDHQGDAGYHDDVDDTSLGAFDAQGVTPAELEKNLKADCCAICGAGHFSPKCTAKTYHELRNRPHAQQRPVIACMRDRSARDKTKDLYISTVDGDKRVCKEINVYGKCNKDCSRPHTCSLCAQPGHGARLCPTYRAEVLGQARDKALASRREQLAPQSSIPNRPPVTPVIPIKRYTVSVATLPTSKLEPRFHGPSSYGCMVRGEDHVESWPQTGGEQYPGPPVEGVLEFLARHRVTEADFAEFAGTAGPRSNEKLVYPAAPQVYLRPDVKLYLESADFVNAAGEIDGTRVSHIMANAAFEPTHGEYLGVAGSAAVAAANAASLATSPNIKTGEEDDSVCQCGIVRKSSQSDKATGRPLAKLVTFTPQGAHLPNALRQDHGSCWAGIPVRDDLRGGLMPHKSRGNFDPSPEEKTKIIDAAIARHRSGQPPPSALDAQELATWEAATRAKIMTRKQSATASQTGPASTNSTGQATLNISSTGAVSAQLVPHAESSAAAEARARAIRQELNSDDLDA